jgi:3-hydroxyisobutyrate dehydrogenase-like beta-hydroxyacid dehydrogenase
MSSSEQESQIGFIGVGVMGRPMARRLIEAGHSLIVYDRDEHAVAELAALGARAAGSVREVADNAGIVFTSLPTPAVFKQVALGDGGLIEGRTLKILVDLSTVGSRTEKEVADGLLAKGIATVDAPVSGGAAGAKKGTLAIMAAGKPAAVNEVQALFEVFGKVFVVGEEPGQGQLLKLLNNMLSSTAFAITSEAFVAGARGGLDPEVMMSVINAGSGKNGATLDKFPKQVRFWLSNRQRLQGHRTCRRRVPGPGRAHVGRQCCASGMELRGDAGRHEARHDRTRQIRRTLVVWRRACRLDRPDATKQTIHNLKRRIT